MNDTIDLLQIRIEKAKAQLPEDTLNAINAVDWKMAISEMRNKTGYTFEQLGDLELETELLLCGLLTPQDYQKELESRMKINKIQANELVNEMNKQVFSKIKEELVKNTERKKIFAKNQKSDSEVLDNAGIEIIPAHPAEWSGAGEKPISAPDVTKEKIGESREDILKKIEKPELIEKPGEETHPILAQKLSGSFQIPIVKTEHSLENITKTNTPNPSDIKSKIPSIDPYREIPE